MDGEIRNYADFINGLLSKAKGHLEGLSREALNWRPLDGETNSVAAIAAHMCGVTIWWIVQGLAGEDAGRDRDSEFRAVVDDQGLITFWGERTTLPSLIERAKSTVESTSEGFQADALDDVINMPRMAPCTKRWAFVHTIDELAQHLGHMELTIQLWAGGEKGNPN
ncbi:MAG: DUF664 domain-containing protein [Dehalococcoidia bacterium]